MIITTTYGDARLTREFWAKTQLDPDTLCWVWIARTSQTGTPMHGAKVAWRFAHERLVGPLVRGSVGRRACDEPLCVNPAHRVTEKPRNCPTCGSPMSQDTRSEIYALADGKVAVSVVPADENPEPMVHDDLPAPRTKFSVQELATAKPSGDTPKPEDDPNNVPYAPDDVKLTRRYKDRGRHLVYETTAGSWVREEKMTDAQYSHLLRELDGDGYFVKDMGWEKVG